MTNFDALVRQRRSVRGFKSNPVPEATMQQIFELAQQAPSNCNSQPWQVMVASGQPCQQLKRALYELAASGQPPQPDFEFKLPFDDHYRQRQMACAQALYGALGIARGDKPKRQRAMLENYRFFDAPHVAFIGMPRQFAINSALDVGIYVQTLMLAMQAKGVASCAQGALAYYPEPIREAFSLDQNLGILLGVAFGYEDADAPANATRTVRAPLTESVQFIGTG